MAQVILIENNSTLHELIALNLTTYVGADVIPRKNAADAIALLELLPGVPLIITRNRIEDEDTASDLANYIKKKKSETGLIVLGEIDPHVKEIAANVPTDLEWEKAIKLAARMLGVTEEFMSKKVQPDYVPVPINYFLPLDSCCCDIFLRIKKGPEEYQYIKRVHRGDNYQKVMVQRYIEDGLTHFYIPKEDHITFTNYFSNRLVSKLEDPDLSDDEQFVTIAESYDAAIHEIKNLGFTSATIQLTDAIINSMVKTFERSPELSPLLYKIINSKTSYIYQHSHLTAIVAAECIKHMEINDKRVYQEKLAYAAFFHDIALVDHEDLAKIHSYEELEKAELSEELWDRVFNHALEGAVLMKKHPEAPAGIEEIILHHHGAGNGKGFVRNVGKLGTLSKIFIISETFTKRLLAFKEKGGKPYPIIEDLYKAYPEPDMKIIIDALGTTLKKKAHK